MESIDLIKLFWIANAILWTFLLLVLLFMGNASILRKRGYDEDYIAFMRKDYTIRAITMAIVIPAIQIASYFITGLFNIDASSHPEAVFLFFIGIVIPFAIIDHFSTKKKIKSLNKGTYTILVVDLKHKVLNLVYHPFLEIILTVITVVYAIFIAKPFLLFYLHIILPWLFYITARSTRIASRPHLKDGYLWAFIFIEINFILILYYLAEYLLSIKNHFNGFAYFLGITLVLLLSARIIYYIVRYPILRQRLSN